MPFAAVVGDEAVYAVGEAKKVRVLELCGRSGTDGREVRVDIQCWKKGETRGEDDEVHVPESPDEADAE